MTLRPGPATLLAAGILLAAGTPAASASELFVQTADTATSTAPKKGLLILTLHDTPQTVLSFDDRPQRRTRMLGLDRYVALWQQSFRADPPNAALVGTRDGRRSQTVVELLSARRVRGGVRYAARALSGRPPRRLRDVSLFVDDYEQMINALRFPEQLTTTARENLTITPEAPFVLSPATSPLTLVLGTLTFRAAARFVANVQEMTWTLPAGQGGQVAAAATPKPTIVTTSATSDLLRWSFDADTSVVIAPMTDMTVGPLSLAAAR